MHKTLTRTDLDFCAVGPAHSDATLSDPKFNVRVKSFVLESSPARITINLEVAGQAFFSKITYHTITSWDTLWQRAGSNIDKSLFLGAIVAWDCMRFMGLGGEILELCEGLSVDDTVQESWRTCFLKQFGVRPVIPVVGMTMQV